LPQSSLHLAVRAIGQLAPARAADLHDVSNWKDRNGRWESEFMIPFPCCADAPEEWNLPVNTKSVIFAAPLLYYQIL